jgi:hypothetical protein
MTLEPEALDLGDAHLCEFCHSLGAEETGFGMNHDFVCSACLQHPFPDPNLGLPDGRLEYEMQPKDDGSHGKWQVRADPRRAI